ncbi:PaaI family thioesterase [Corynebacterium sp. H130]|uniref:PaaI family thioesterase n=1 Tax=Corynebacterium sp. H130 TaxID=3133444 RepID=UPI0030A9246D
MEILPLFIAAKDRFLTDDELAELNAADRGFSNHIGLRFTQVSAKKVRAEIPVTQELLQVSGLVNGGVYCAIAETLGSVAGMCASAGAPVVGLSNSTNFLASCGSGVIEAEATTIHAGRSTQAFEIRCYHRDKLLSTTVLRTMVLAA